MKKLVVFTLLVSGLLSCQPKTEVAETVEPPKPQPIEFADAKYSDMCKVGLAFLTSKDIDAFVSSMSDNAIYRFNNGDSIAGKPAITAYWKERMTNAIDKIDFSDDVWLSLKANEPPKGVLAGNWVMGWFRVTATYKTGKSMTQYIHTLYHFNTNDKIDEVIQYLDRAPIIAAMTPEKNKK